MACAIYPQSREFCDRIEKEAVAVVKRLRQHPCLVLWCGDNECDQAYDWYKTGRNPNENILTRRILPEVVRLHDPHRNYLPSSPYVDDQVYREGAVFMTESHLWGPRDYFKSDYYNNSLCHFASEIGYHGCPSPVSIRKFISPEKLWPCEDNDEWILHASNPEPFPDAPYSYRIKLMANQVKELFGEVPDNLPAFALLSQISQAEAKKYFIELFRAAKWRRTGIIWWNILDGWPQFSDSVVDYYFEKKLAYHYIRNAQQDFCLILAEPRSWQQNLLACNDTREDRMIRYAVKDLETGAVLRQDEAFCPRDAATVIGQIPFCNGSKAFYLIEWTGSQGSGKNHYLAGNPPFDATGYVRLLRRLVAEMSWDFDFRPYEA
jgi:beta-mannosidase